jgi:hypothetical protein
MINGIFPRISITAKRTIEATPISLRFKPLLPSIKINFDTISLRLFKYLLQR